MRRSIQLFLTFSILVACLSAEVRTEDDHERARVRVVPESMGDKAARMTRKAGDTVKGFTEEAAKTVHRFAGSTDDDKYGDNTGHREEELVDKSRERGRVRTRPETMSETAERVARQAGETAKGFTNEAAKTVHRFAGSDTETEQGYETKHKHAHPTSWHKGHLRGGDADTASESDESVGSGETEWETETDREGRPTGRYRSRAPGWETETETGARPYDLMLLGKSKKTKEKGETASDRDTSGRKKVGEFDNRSGAGRYPIYEGDWESGTHDERTVGEKISDTAKGAVETVKKAGQRVAEVTKNAFGNTTETVKSVGNKTVETVKGAGEKTAETAKSAGGKVKEGVKGTAETGKEAVVGAEQAAEKKAAESKAKFQKTGEDKRTREAAAEAAETAREKDTAALEKARKKAAAAAERVKETAEETGEATKEKAKEAAEKVKETATGAKEKTKEVAEKAAEKARESKEKVRDTYLTGTKAPHHKATPTEAYMPAGTDTGPYLGMSEHAERMRAAQPEVSRTETTTHTRVSPTETISERLGTLAVTPTETVSIGTLAAREHRETAGRPTVAKTTTVTREKSSRIDSATRDELQHALDGLEKSVAAGDASPDDVRKAYRKAAEKIRNVLRERGDELRERMKHGKIDDRSVDLEMRRESRMKRTIDLLAVAAGDTMGGDMDEEARGDTGDLAKVTLQDCIKDLEREQSGGRETETENLLTIDPKSSHSKASKSEALAEDTTVTTEKRTSGLGGTATETVTETVTTEHGMGAMEGSMGGKLHTRIGQTVLWTVFGIMAFSAFYFVTAAGAYESHKRVFHYITGAICGIAALSYLCMALGIGMFRFADGREFYYARYWDWMFTTPLLLVDLGLLAGTAGSEIFFVVAADALMIASGLVGSYQPGSAKWYLFAFGVLALLPVIYSLVTSFRTKALLYSPEVGELFNQLTMLTLVTWAAYPLVWVLAEGTRWISVDVEIVLYGILDVAAKALFGFILLSHRHVIEKASAQEHLLGG